MIRLLKTAIETGSVIRGYPFEPEPAPETLRGQVQLDTGRCRGDGDCARACPSAAISVEPGANGWTWTLTDARCVFCGLCQDACPSGAISLSREFELATLRSVDLTTRVEFRGRRTP